MWLKVRHKSKGEVLMNSDLVLYFREIDDDHGGKDCEAYFNFTDFVVIDEPRAEVEKQLAAGKR
jgi:hypothetical protein